MCTCSNVWNKISELQEVLDIAYRKYYIILAFLKFIEKSNSLMLFVNMSFLCGETNFISFLYKNFLYKGVLSNYFRFHQFKMNDISI